MSVPNIITLESSDALLYKKMNNDLDSLRIEARTVQGFVISYLSEKYQLTGPSLEYLLKNGSIVIDSNNNSNNYIKLEP